ncbi:MAG: hypothetical protein IJG13_02380 [Kiritimatiellae bacterium]|nr:hypothetical protein [Kiritimatiellia bacterium]
MKTGFSFSAAAAAIFVLAAFSACGERELTIGEYAEEVKERVVEKIKEALSGEGRVAEVSGTVTFAAGGVFFLQRDDDGLKVFAKGRLPKTGDVVTVEGSPSLEGGRVVFVASKWKRTESQPLPAARPVSSEEIIHVGGAKKDVNWLRVEIEGRVIGATETGFALNVDGVPVNVMTDDEPQFLSDADLTHPKVTVRGVIEQMLDQSALVGREKYVIGVKVNVGSEEDMTLVPDLLYMARSRSRLVTVVASATAAVLAAALLVVAVVVVRQRRRLFRSRTIMAERRRMADDLHDTIEQHLVGAGMLIKLNRTQEAQEALVRAKREVRDVVWGLKNDDMMRLSPAEMLHRLAHEETAKGICRVEARVDGLPPKMDAASMRDLSLIVREAIGNAVKHGGAKRVAISSDAIEGGGWLLRIANDGAPFDPESAPGAKDGHFGLEGMRQRARRLGATVSFARRKAGMVVELSHPASAR